MTTTSAYPQQASMYPQASSRTPMSQPSMYPQVVAPIPAVAPATAQPSTPQPLPKTRWRSPVKRSGTANRLVNGLLVLSLVAAAGGVGYAVGRQTAPAQSTANGFPNLNGFSGFGDGSGTTGNGTTGNGTTGNGTTGTTGNTGQVAAPAARRPSRTAPRHPGPASSQRRAQGGTGQQGGGFPGLGAGLTGTVTAVADGTVSYTSADGQTVQVATTADTTYHQQQAATAADDPGHDRADRHRRRLRRWPAEVKAAERHRERCAGWLPGRRSQRPEPHRVERGDRPRDRRHDHQGRRPRLRSGRPDRDRDGHR
ncbi:MAG: hypothetical protein U0667_06305 [Chloroflexota bacterium]